MVNFKHPGVDKSLARPGRKEARKHVRDACDFNKIETRAVIKFLFLQGKAPKEIHAILTETIACFLPGRAKDLPALLYKSSLSIVNTSRLKDTIMQNFKRKTGSSSGASDTCFIP